MREFASQPGSKVEADIQTRETWFANAPMRKLLTADFYVKVPGAHVAGKLDEVFLMITSTVGSDGLRDCFRDPIPEIFEAAALISEASSAHLRGNQKAADEFLRAADIPLIGEWLDTIWMGQNNAFRAVRKVPDLPKIMLKADRAKPRDATQAMKKALVARDGFHCRLCGIPLIRAEVRRAFNKLYPEAARWTGIRANEQHRGLQVMWLQYDHIIVHSRGGETSMDNLVVTCPACNYGRDKYMMSEVGLRDPRSHPRQPSWKGSFYWDGIEQILPTNLRYHFTAGDEMPSEGSASQ